ncbi:CMGC protein kinase [Glonium stellatum]|uniref:non-specific serine/threonine protein kinase n=1 Tax=Glonium stellatum TaxID=574774 RepID=A0A8E2JZF4_9PEZI|nr:CMGC protein kinase [Glonium stellatum]
MTGSGGQMPHFLKRFPALSAVPTSTTKISKVSKSSRRIFAFTSLRVPRSLPKTVEPEILPSDELLEEEHAHWYKPEEFYQVNPGDVFNDRYQAITKLGWGMTSTIWLARDLHRWRWQAERYVVLKVGRRNCKQCDLELDISNYISQRNPSHDGFSYVRHLVDGFDMVTLDGTYTCLVQEPMREPLSMFRQRFTELPLTWIKQYTKMLLMGLDYLHSECHLVHTDLKPANILMEIEDLSVLEDFVRSQVQNPMARKIKDGRTIYRVNHSMGKLRSYNMRPKIADFGQAISGDVDHRMDIIQPNAFRAPEVIFGVGWGCSADIWNFGLMIWHIVETTEFFKNVNNPDDKYDCPAHLAEMIGLLGPPPKEMIAREMEARQWTWDKPMLNWNGQPSMTVSEFFGGPFFDSEGEFMFKHLIPKGISLEDSLSCLEGEEKTLFLSFMRKMLQWLPEGRKTARELIEDPWLVIEE